MNKQQLAVVSALVGACRNLGVVIPGFCFCKPIYDPLLPFQVHAGQDMSFFGLCCPLATTGGSMGACSKAQLWIRSDKTFVDMTSADKTSEPAGEKPQAAESTEMTV